VSAPISVRGGAGGIDAHCDDMLATARLFGHCASDTADQALRLHSYLMRPELAETAVFDPVGAARFEATMFGALDGPAGVTVLAARCGVLDAGLRVAAEAYAGADRLADSFSQTVGFLRNLPHAQWDAVATLISTGDVAAAAQRWITENPQAVDLLAGGAAGLVGTTSIAQATTLLGRLYPDGQAKVTALGRDPSVDAAGPPRTLASVMTGLARRNDGTSGEIDVRILTSPGAEQRRVIVDIPGTKDWSPTRHNGDITSIATNLRALAGTSTSYERGVVQAMRQAGIQPSDDVMLVGHSEGGMVAINAAIHAASSGQFQIGHVVTAGAPIGAVAARVPRRVEVLALENEGDLVPHLDNVENPDRSNLTTVAVRHNHGAVAANHRIWTSYVPGAADIDASDNPSSRAFLADIQPFLAAETVTTHAFQITRTYR
jgi:hypothetical protein